MIPKLRHSPSCSSDCLTHPLQILVFFFFIILMLNLFSIFLFAIVESQQRGPLVVPIMDPGLRYLIGLVFYTLKQVKVWWHLPLVLTMTYTFYVRERLLSNSLFDAYPNPLPQAKRRCNDPVLGKVDYKCLSFFVIIRSFIFYAFIKELNKKRRIS